jgi:hypothetical protein
MSGSHALVNKLWPACCAGRGTTRVLSGWECVGIPVLDLRRVPG